MKTAIGKLETIDLNSDYSKWYSDESIKRLVYSKPKEMPLLRYVFSYSSDANARKQFMIQFKHLISLKNALKVPVYFIFIRPGNFIGSHFIFGMLVDEDDGVKKNLIIINPLGDEAKADFYETMFQVRESGLVNHIVISNTVIQRDRGGIVSCGPLCVELFDCFSKLSKEQILRVVSIIKPPTKKELSYSSADYTLVVELTYTSIDISSLLPKHLKDLLNCEPQDYETQLDEIRRKHNNIKTSLLLDYEQRLVFEMDSGKEISGHECFLMLKQELDMFKNKPLKMARDTTGSLNVALSSNFSVGAKSGAFDHKEDSDNDKRDLERKYTLEQENGKSTILSLKERPTLSKPLKDSATLNVSGDRNNCGLFALILGVKIALNNKPSCNTLRNCEFLDEIDESSLQRTTEKTTEIGKKLRAKMYEALLQDHIYKKRRYVSFSSLCRESLEKESIVNVNIGDMQAFFRSNVDYIKKWQQSSAIKQILELELEGNQKKYCEYLKQNVIEMAAIDELKSKLLKLVSPSPDEKAIHELIENAYKEEKDIVSRFIKQSRLFSAAWEGVTGSYEEGIYRNLLSEKINEIFKEKILNILKTRGENFNRNLLWFACLEKTKFDKDGFLKTICVKEEILSTAISFFIEIDLLENWNQVYENYCSYIQDSTEMLTADELGCLASYLNVQLTIEFRNRAPYQPYQVLNSQLLHVTLCNPSEIHWMLICEGVHVVSEDNAKMINILSKIQNKEYVENIVNAISNQTAYEQHIMDCSYLVGVFSAISMPEEFKKRGEPLSDVDAKLARELSSLLFPEDQILALSAKAIYELAPALKEFLGLQKKSSIRHIKNELDGESKDARIQELEKMTLLKNKENKGFNENLRRDTFEQHKVEGLQENALETKSKLEEKNKKKKAFNGTSILRPSSLYLEKASLREKFSESSKSASNNQGVEEKTYRELVERRDCKLGKQLIRYQETITLLHSYIQEIIKLDFFKDQYEYFCNTILFLPDLDYQTAESNFLESINKYYNIFLKVKQQKKPLTEDERIRIGRGHAIFITREGVNNYVMHFSDNMQYCKINFIKQYNEVLIKEFRSCIPFEVVLVSENEKVYNILKENDVIHERRWYYNRQLSLNKQLYPCGKAQGYFQAFMQQRQDAICHSLVSLKNAWTYKVALKNLLSQIEKEIQDFYKHFSFDKKNPLYDKVYEITGEIFKIISLFSDDKKMQSLSDILKELIQTCSNSVSKLTSLLLLTEEQDTLVFIVSLAIEFQKIDQNRKVLDNLELLSNALQSQREIVDIGEAILRVNKAVGFQWLQKYANNGDRRAQFMLGCFYENRPDIVSKNFKKAIHYYELSASLGYANAACALGDYYAKNIKMDSQYFIEAIKWYRKGLDLEKLQHIEKFLAQLEKQLEENDCDGSLMFTVGTLYYKGKETVKSIEEAIKWYEKAIKKENLLSKISLGSLYEQEKKYPEAIFFYNLALEQAPDKGEIKQKIDELKKIMNGRDLYALGQEYAQISKNYFFAVEWYLLAVSKGSGDAKKALEEFNKTEDLKVQYALGRFYLEKNEIFYAVQCFIKAEQENPEAYKELERIAESEQYRNKSAQSAQRLLGEFYEGRKDFEKAMACYEISSDLNRQFLTMPWEIKDTECSDDGEEEVVEASFQVKPLTYTPLKQSSLAPLFYQREIKFELFPYKLEGVYSGTLNGNGVPHGFGNFKFQDKNTEHEILYSGSWEQGIWHGGGDFREIFHNGGVKVSIQISNGNFKSGGKHAKLVEEAGYNNAHIVVTKRDIQIHYYGTMRQAQNNQFFGSALKCLEKSICAKEFYFESAIAHNDSLRIGQVEINQGAEQYVIVGKWVLEGQQKLTELIRDDFKERKLRLLSDIKQKITAHVLSCDETSRYKISGFLKIFKTKNLSLLKFVSMILNEKDESICTAAIKSTASKLKLMIELTGEIKDLITTETNDEIVEEVEDLIINYVENQYLIFLKNYNMYDADALGYMSPDRLLFVDPNILKMICDIRQRIHYYWRVSPKFDLDLSQLKYEREEDLKEIKELFIDCWGAYFQVSPKVNKELYKLINYDGDKKVYENLLPGHEGFVQRAGEIKVASESYVLYFGYSTQILDSTKNIGVEHRLFMIKFYQDYCQAVLSHPFHLENDLLVNYKEKYMKFIEKVMTKDLMEIFARRVSNEVVLGNIKQFFTALVKENDLKMSHILNIIEYFLTIKDSIGQKDLCEVEEIIKIQVSILYKLLGARYNNFDKIRQVVIKFGEFLKNYNEARRNSIMFNKDTLIEIFKHYQHLLEHILTLNAVDINDDTIIKMCDFIDKQSVLLDKIKCLPLFVDSKEIQELLAVNQVAVGYGKKGVCKIPADRLQDFLALIRRNQLEVPHYSYKILEEVLKTLSGLFFKVRLVGKEYDDSWSFQEKFIIGREFYDVLVELSNQLENQISYQKLGTYKADKTRYFKGVDTMNAMELTKYLGVLKKMMAITGNQLEIPLEDAVEGFLKLNPASSRNERSELLRVYEKYIKKFEAFRKLYNTVCLSDIATHLQNIADRDQDKKIKNEGSTISRLKYIGQEPLNQERKVTCEENIVSQLECVNQGTLLIEYQENNSEENILTLLAGLSWMLTVKASEMDDENGRFNSKFKTVELRPHVIQILGCIKLLNIDKLSNQNMMKICEWLPRIPKQIGQILTGQGKSWQISLLSMIYALFDYDVIVACYSEYLSSRDASDFKKYFSMMQEKAEKVKFKTLEALASDQFDGNQRAPNEQVRSVVEQVIYQGEYVGACSDAPPNNGKQILIVDEVDTLISSELNNGLGPHIIITNQSLADAMEKLYTAAKIADVTLESSVMKPFEVCLLEHFKENTLLFNQYKNEIMRSANLVAGFYSDDPVRKEKCCELLTKYGISLLKFRLNQDGPGVEYYSQDEWHTDLLVSYYNAFFYLEFSQSIEKKDYSAYGYLKLECGHIYYSSVVSTMTKNLMLGVTGSIRDMDTGQYLLSKAERDILGRGFLGVESTAVTFFPSFYGEARVDFKPNPNNPDSKKYFSILANEEMWLKEIYERCCTYSSEGKAVLVFFKDENYLNEMFERLRVKDPYKVYRLTNHSISVNRQGDRKHNNQDYRKSELRADWQASINKLVTEFSGRAGHITLAMVRYGRGTDFQCKGLDEKGGLHVIQSWFSEDPKEETQIRGRTARNGARGTYMQVICLTHLKPHCSNPLFCGHTCGFHISYTHWLSCHDFYSGCGDPYSAQHESCFNHYFPGRPVQDLIRAFQRFQGYDYPKDWQYPLSCSRSCTRINKLTVDTSYSTLKSFGESSMQEKYESLKGKLQQHQNESSQVLTWLKNAREDRAKKLGSNQATEVDKDIVKQYNKDVAKLS